MAVVVGSEMTLEAGGVGRVIVDHTDGRIFTGRFESDCPIPSTSSIFYPVPIPVSISYTREHSMKIRGGTWP